FASRAGVAAMGCKHNTLRQRDVGQVQRGARQQVDQVDFDELGQICRQADDFEFSHNVTDDRAAKLDGWRLLGIDEVQRHFGVQCLRSVNTLEVDVQYLLLVWVPLHRTQQNLLGLAVQFHA